MDGGICIAQRKERWLLMLSILIVIVAAGILIGFKQKEVPPATPAKPDLTLSNYPKLFENDVVIVIRENASQIEMEGAQAIADNLRNLTGNVPVIKKDFEIREDEKAKYNLILVGRPDTNSAFRDVYERTNATSVTEEYPGAGKGVLEILRSPWNEEKAMLLVEGSDEWGVKAGIELLKQTKENKSSVIVQKETPTAGTPEVIAAPLQFYMNVSEVKSFRYMDSYITISYPRSSPEQFIKVKINDEETIIIRNRTEKCPGNNCGSYLQKNNLHISIIPVIWMINEYGERTGNSQTWNTSEIYAEIY